jgi:DNA-binding protein YbaB
VTEAIDDSAITAVAADGLVRVVLRADGRIESVRFAPRVKRLALADLADAITEALSTAQRELLRRATEARRTANRDKAERLSAELDRINAEYLRKTAVYDALGTEILKRMEG